MGLEFDIIRIVNKTTKRSGVGACTAPNGTTSHCTLQAGNSGVFSGEIVNRSLSSDQG